MCTSSRYWLIIYHNRLLSYIILHIVGGPNKQEFWFRRMHLKFILDEPLPDLSEIGIKVHDKFVLIVRGSEDLCIIHIHAVVNFRLSGKTGIQTMLLLMNYTTLQLLFKLGWTSSIKQLKEVMVCAKAETFHDTSSLPCLRYKWSCRWVMAGKWTKESGRFVEGIEIEKTVFKFLVLWAYCK